MLWTSATGGGVLLSGTSVDGTAGSHFSQHLRSNLKRFCSIITGSEGPFMYFDPDETMLCSTPTMENNSLLRT